MPNHNWIKWGKKKDEKDVFLLFSQAPSFLYCGKEIVWFASIPVRAQPLFLPPLFIVGNACWFPDLDDSMTRSAGRWSPFAALTTSPTATWYYQTHTSRGRDRGGVAVVCTGGKWGWREGGRKQNKIKVKQGEKEGLKWNKTHVETQQTHKGQRDNGSVSGRCEEQNGQSCLIKGMAAHLFWFSETI